MKVSPSGPQPALPGPTPAAPARPAGPQPGAPATPAAPAEATPTDTRIQGSPYNSYTLSQTVSFPSPTQAGWLRDNPDAQAMLMMDDEEKLRYLLDKLDLQVNTLRGEGRTGEAEAYQDIRKDLLQTAKSMKDFKAQQADEADNRMRQNFQRVQSEIQNQ